MTSSPWGPLAAPIRSEAPERQDLPWRDNAYLGFWDTDQRIIGACHVSTSPTPVCNRKISFNLVVDGHQIELLEEVGTARTATDHIEFDLNGRITVNHPDIRAEVRATPYLPPGPYGDILPGIGQAASPFHIQGGGQTRGWVELGDTRHTIAGGAYRDRTSGYRNDADQFPEYLALMATFDGLSITALNMIAPDGSQQTQGFVITPDHTTKVLDILAERTGAGLTHSLRLVLDGQPDLTLHMTDKLGTIWIPTGPPTTRPVLEVMEEFLQFRTNNGRDGAGIAEQGIVRRVGTLA